jgi:membrane dipeptidase
MPEGLEDVSRYPALFEELATRGYRDEDLMKIAGRNVLRVMREAARTGGRLRTERPASNATIELDAALNRLPSENDRARG